MSDGLVIVGALANVAVAVVAALALYLAWRQIKMSRELSALEAYEKYHEMCLQYPVFSSGAVEFEKFDSATLKSYEVYVLYTLMVSERIYALFPNDDGWCYSVMDDIRMHKTFIKSPHFSEHLAGQGWKVRPLITRVLDEVDVNPDGSTAK